MSQLPSWSPSSSQQENSTASLHPAALSPHDQSIDRALIWSEEIMAAQLTPATLGILFVNNLYEPDLVFNVDGFQRTFPRSTLDGEDLEYAISRALDDPHVILLAPGAYAWLANIPELGEAQGIVTIHRGLTTLLEFGRQPERYA